MRDPIRQARDALYASGSNVIRRDVGRLAGWLVWPVGSEIAKGCRMCRLDCWEPAWRGRVVRARAWRWVVWPPCSWLAAGTKAVHCGRRGAWVRAGSIAACLPACAGALAAGLACRRGGSVARRGGEPKRRGGPGRRGTRGTTISKCGARCAGARALDVLDCPGDVLRAINCGRAGACRGVVGVGAPGPAETQKPEASASSAHTWAGAQQHAAGGGRH